MDHLNLLGFSNEKKGKWKYFIDEFIRVIMRYTVVRLKKKKFNHDNWLQNFRQSQRVTKVEKKKEKKRKKDLRFAQFRHVGRQVEGDAVGRAGQRGAADEQHQQ